MLLSRVNEIPGKSLDFATAVSSCNSFVFHLLHHKTTTAYYPKGNLMNLKEYDHYDVHQWCLIFIVSAFCLQW